MGLTRVPSPFERDHGPEDARAANLVDQFVMEAMGKNRDHVREHRQRNSSGIRPWKD
jgi:hypothetical protein